MSISVKELINQSNGKPLVGEYVHVSIGGNRRTLEIIGVRTLKPMAIFVAGDTKQLSLSENTPVDLQASPFSRDENFHGDTLI